MVGMHSIRTWQAILYSSSTYGSALQVFEVYTYHDEV